MIDGKNIKYVTQTSLREKIGVVAQDCILFNDTIGYNIAYGAVSKNLGELDKRERMVEAAREAHIEEFIMKTKDKWETTVGERGLRLSGGEKQRVAIARVIMKDPPILILDEATSALDSKTEREIQESLNNLSKSRTTVVIAHRLSTIRNAHEILVLKEGSIVEQGSHDQLLEKKGEYFEMWNQQKQNAEGLSSIEGKKEGRDNLMDIIELN